MWKVRRVARRCQASEPTTPTDRVRGRRRRPRTVGHALQLRSSRAHPRLRVALLGQRLRSVDWRVATANGVLARAAVEGALVVQDKVVAITAVEGAVGSVPINVVVARIAVDGALVDENTVVAVATVEEAASKVAEDEVVARAAVERAAREVADDLIVALLAVGAAEVVADRVVARAAEEDVTRVQRTEAID